VAIRPLAVPSPALLAPLLAASEAEGFGFLRRLAREWESGGGRFDGPGEVLLGICDGPAWLAVGGLTADPYSPEAGLGRLRHIYVRADVRRSGLGRMLVEALEAHARPRFRALVLRTDTESAARFYETLGYRRLPPDGTATHRRDLAPFPG
jgi:GNAT superfamily N-acetyltransferase